MGTYCRPTQAATYETLSGAGVPSPRVRSGLFGCGPSAGRHSEPLVSNMGQGVLAAQVCVRQVWRAQDPKESKCVERQDDGVTGGAA